MAEGRPGQVLFFVRHGQTDWNREGRLQGRLDIPMNARGKEQVRANARKLKKLLAEPERLSCIASPLGRTRRTMEIVRREMGLEPRGYETDERLREMSYGEFAGHTWDELRALRPWDVRRRFADPWSYVVPGGESYGEMARRVESWLAEIEESGRSAIIATHAGIIRILLSRHLGTARREIAFLDAPQDRVLVLRGGAMSWL
jgi:probable phosphoglycerate mutase